MRYLTIGTGGVGGMLDACLQRAGLLVSFLAHGKTLEALKKKGFTLVKDSGEETFSPIAAFDEANYNETPDVISLALKSYSTGGVLPFLERIATEHIVIVPLCNVFGAREKLQKKLGKPLIMDGRIYMIGNVEEAGKVRQLGSLMRVVYDVRKPEEARLILEEVEAELTQAGAEVVLSDNVRRDCMKKFAYFSPHNAAGVYFYITAAHLQREDEYRNFHRGLVREVLTIAEKMDIVMDGYNEVDSLRVMDELAPKMTTSFQKGIADIRKSGVDGLAYEVQRLGVIYGVPTPYYGEAIEAFHSCGAG